MTRDGGRRFSVALPSSRFGTRHWPDAVLLDGDQSVALEIELTAKAPDRLRAILAGYRDSGYTTVRYLTGSPSVAARVTRLADAEGLPSVAPGPWHQTLLEVRPLDR